MPPKAQQQHTSMSKEVVPPSIQHKTLHIQQKKRA